MSKNEEAKTFEQAIRVFVDLKQTPVTSDLPVETRPAPQTSSGENQIVRLHSSRACIRHKTVESPAMLKPGSAAPGSLLPQPPAPQPPAPQPQQLVPTPQEDHTISLSSQEPNSHPALPRTRLPRHRQRYSFKSRTGDTNRPPPEKMKLYKFKPYKELMDTAQDVTESDNTKSKAKAKPKPTLKTLEGSSASSRKLNVTRLMAYQHPTSCLGVGTLRANIGHAVQNNSNLKGQVVQCIQDAVRDAASTKRRGQRVIGRFIEHVNCMEPQLDDADRVFLDLLCPRVTKKDAQHYKDDKSKDNNGEGEDTCLGVSTTLKKNDQQSFLWSFLVHLYSGNYPRAQGIGQKVNDFIDRLSHLGIYSPPRPRQAINEKTLFTPTDLLESVMGQLRVELTKMYKNGSCDLHQKLKKLKDKGLLGPNVDIGIREDLSAIENYLTLNKLSKNPWKIIPLTLSNQPFITFSERELAGFFYGHGRELRMRLQILVQGACTSIKDVQEWVASKEPGFLIKRFLADINPTNLTARKRGKVGHRAAIKLLTIDQLEDHLRMLDDNDFQPETYTSKEYVPRGSIRTNGFSLQLLCFKRRELLSVKYKRLPDDQLPPRLTSTLHGTSDTLTEIRNVLATKEDVARLWPNIDPRDIKTLTLDAGQAFVVGAYAHLPQAGNKDKSPSFKGSFSLASSSASTPQDLMQKVTLEQQAIMTPPTTTDLNKIPHHNLAVNQKAVMQPVFRFRRWFEDEKQKIPDGQSESIAHIESSLPPLRGHEANVTNYIERLEQVEDRLLEFYNGNNNRFKKHTWDMERAKHIEYQAIANSLLGIIGGSVGEHRKEDNRVLIGVGLGQFGSSSRLSSLHSSFLSYFVPLARSLGYIVVGLNEFYTSKKCPSCQEFVAQVTLRELFCPHCRKYYHRDVMAAQNMSNIVRGYIENQNRPRYLQPLTADGRYPWEEDTISSSTNDASASSSSAPPRGRKRPCSVSNLSRKRGKKEVKEVLP
ncbi:hypothetical protein BGZ82_004071 [Podila clonocystis]|nr:hypothetical protein BGZ82_004071 [Podila clonocystis]